MLGQMYTTLLSFSLIIAAGVLFRRSKIGGIDADTLRSAINASVLNLFLPALCVKTVYTSAIDTQTMLVPVIAWITTGLLLLLSLFIYTLSAKIMRIKPEETGVLILSATFGNVTYLGLPVLTGLYGEEAAKYALFYDLLATTPALWTLGAAVASRYGSRKSLSLSDSLRIVITLPPIWGIGGGLLLKTAGIPLPYFVLKAFSMLGEVVVPLMIFSIGLALTLPRVNHAVSSIPAIVLKLLIAPSIAYITALLIGLKGEALASCLLEGAMPTMVLSLLIAARFRLDVSLSAFMIVITTALSFFTLPLGVYLSGILVF